MMVGAIRPRGVLDDDPVADAGQTGIFEFEAQPSGELRAARAGRGPDLVGAAVLGGDAGRDGPRDHPIA